ncbi:MAG: reverse transcriptase/maturase family protein [Parcubacteria group bacterium]
MSFDYDELISVENLFESWRAYKKGKNKKTEVMEFERHLEDNLFALHRELQEGNYNHSEYSYFRISDPKKRDIYKSKVRDRVVHQAVYKYLCGIYEAVFIENSFSSRKNKGTHRAVCALFEMAKKIKRENKGCLAIKSDVRKYFENINHKILLEVLHKKIQDENFFNLLKIIIQSFNGGMGKGVPLGNITSQIFANIYLNELDEFVRDDLNSGQYARYNDDFIMLGNNGKKLFGDAAKAKIFLRDELLLDLPKEKTTFRKLRWGIDFCGFVVLPNAILLRNKTKGRMFANIKMTVKKLHCEKISTSDSRRILDSYFGILSHCKAYNLKTKIKNKYLYGEILE